MRDRDPRTMEDTAGLVTWLVQHARLVWRLLLDGRVPIGPKFLIALVCTYLVVPLDLVPEIVLGLGVVDDLALVALAVRLFIGLCPQAYVHEHLDDIRAGRPRRDRSSARVTVIDVPSTGHGEQRR